MIQIVLDAAVHEKLRDLSGPAELVTPEGVVIAKVIPQLPTGPTIDDAEIRRRLANKDKTRAYTTAEVIKHLENLDV